jgi:uncharacterized hydrophobic protein (TIGR00341 family)
MALRLIEMVIPGDKRKEVESSLKDQPVLTYWNEEITDKRTLIKILLSSKETEGVLDFLEEKFASLEDVRIILLSVEASIPREEEAEEEASKERPQIKKSEKKINRVSREELYSDINDATSLNTVYLGMIILASIIASVGIYRKNIAVIVGAMIIAPMLGPNMALSLSATLGDLKLARKSLITNSSGIGAALFVSVFLGFFMPIDTEILTVVVRNTLGLGDFALALSVGCAGALAFTSGISSTLIGVMVAVALLPPLVTFGLMVGGGCMTSSWDALLLFLTNLICVNLAGVVTFLVRGIRPLSWWEANRAKKSTIIAVLVWILLLGALALVIFLSKI